MSREYAEQFWGSVLENMALYLLDLGVGDDGEKGVESCTSGDLIHVRVRNSKGEVAFQVVGKDNDELGAQLALACLHKISIDDLRALHKEPLRKPLELRKV